MAAVRDLRLLCQPRWATQRHPDRPTLGGEAGKIGRALLGQPLMPWQQSVFDVGLELQSEAAGDPNPGQLAYREIVITIPRQSGKTTLWLTLASHRSVPMPGSPRPWAGRPQRSAFTMQSGWDAHKKLVNDHGPMLIGSALSAALDSSRARDGMTRGVGNAAILFVGGSRIDVVSSSETAGHGLTLDLAGIDEAFADVDDRREQALVPTMATRRSPQVLVTSTAGTDASVYLLRKVEVGRAAVETADRRSGIAYFEWSAPHDGERFADGHIAQWDDPETWWRCMPALGHTIDLPVIQHALKSMKPGQFRRAYLNQWTKSTERVIPDDIWQLVQTSSVGPQDPLTFAVDVPPDRGSAAIAASDAAGVVELVDHREGTSWAEERLLELVGRHGGRVALDVGGPAASLETALERAKVDLIKMRSSQVAQACGLFYDGVADQKLLIRRDERLDDALTFAGRHPVGDAWRWGRRTIAGDVTPLVAVTLAHWAAKQPREEAARVAVISLDDL